MCGELSLCQLLNFKEMFIPLFIAIMLGLVSPSQSNNACSHGAGTTVSINGTGDEGGGDTGDNGGGGSEGVGGDTGGENGHVHPPKP